LATDGERYRAREGLVVSGDGESRFLTDLSTGNVYELNETAILIFEAARDGETVAGIIERMAKTYPEVPREELDRDARDAVEDFVRAGILAPRAD
jgi:hypothetical protein